MLEKLERRDHKLEDILVPGTGAVRLSVHLKEKLHEKLPNAMVLDALLATEQGGVAFDTTTDAWQVGGETLITKGTSVR